MVGASLSASLPVGGVAEEECDSQVSPPASAGAARRRAQEDQRVSVGVNSLEHTARAENSTCEDGTGSASQQQIISGGGAEERERDLEHEQRDLSDGVLPAYLVVTDSTQGPVGHDAQRDKKGPLASVTSSAGRGQGRRRGRNGSGSAKNARNRRQEELSGGNGGAQDESPAKIDTEWENEIAKNILSLYQTKLKADLDVKKGAKEYEHMVSLSLSVIRLLWVGRSKIPR